MIDRIVTTKRIGKAGNSMGIFLTKEFKNMFLKPGDKVRVIIERIDEDVVEDDIWENVTGL